MSTPVVVQGTAISNPYVPTATATTTNDPNVNNNQNGHIIGGGGGGGNNNNNEGGSSSGGGGGGGFRFFGTNCNDPLFAALFYINIIAMIFVAVTYGGNAISSSNGTDDFDPDSSSFTESSYDGYIIAVVLTGILSLFASGIGLLILMKFPETIIKVALIFVVVMMGIMMVISFLFGQLFGTFCCFECCFRFSLIVFSVCVCVCVQRALFVS